MWRMIYFVKKATDAIWDSNRCCLGAFSFFVKKSVECSFLGAFSFRVRTQGVGGRCLDLPERLKIPDRLRNTGTTTVIEKRKYHLVVVMVGEGVKRVSRVFVFCFYK